MIGRNFYCEAQKKLDVNAFKSVVEFDYEILSTIILPVTLKEIQIHKQKSLEKYLRQYIKHKLSQFVNKLDDQVIYIQFVEKNS